MTVDQPPIFEIVQTVVHQGAVLVPVSVLEPDKDTKKNLKKKNHNPSLMELIYIIKKDQ